MATVRTEVAAGGGKASVGGWDSRFLLIALVVLTLSIALVGMLVSRSHAGRARAVASTEPVYLHGRNLQGLDPITPVYLHGRNLRGLDPLPTD